MVGAMNRFWGQRRGKPVHGRTGFGLTTAHLLALGVVVLCASPQVQAQRVEMGGVKSTPALTRVSAEMDGEAAASPHDHGASPVARPAPPSMAALLNAHPEGWEIYLKGGAVFSLGDGFLEKHIATGWTVQLGLRHAFHRPAGQPWMLFTEFGGGYAANPGRENSPVTTSGIVHFQQPSDDHIHVENNFYDTSLVELQRLFVQGAFGAYYYPSFLNEPGERLVHVNARLGARAGGMRAVYGHEVQLGLRRIWEAHAGPRGHGHRPEAAQYFPDAKDPELFFGLFGSIGTGFTFYDAKLFGRPFADITLGLDIELGHDWFNPGAYSVRDRGWANYTPSMSLSFSF